jgi:hypothetical protein
MTVVMTGPEKGRSGKRVLKTPCGDDIECRRSARKLQQWVKQAWDGLRCVLVVPTKKKTVGSSMSGRVGARERV